MHRCVIDSQRVLRKRTDVNYELCITRQRKAMNALLTSCQLKLRLTATIWLT